MVVGFSESSIADPLVKALTRGRGCYSGLPRAWKLSEIAVSVRSWCAVLVVLHPFHRKHFYPKYECKVVYFPAAESVPGVWWERWWNRHKCHCGGGEMSLGEQIEQHWQGRTQKPSIQSWAALAGRVLIHHSFQHLVDVPWGTSSSNYCGAWFWSEGPGCAQVQSCCCLGFGQNVTNVLGCGEGGCSATGNLKNVFEDKSSCFAVWGFCWRLLPSICRLWSASLYPSSFNKTSLFSVELAVGFALFLNKARSLETGACWSVSVLTQKGSQLKCSWKII